MIVFGTTELLMSLPPGSFNNIYNLCSPYDVGIRLHHLIPLTLNIEDPNFDFIYADYILNNNGETHLVINEDNSKEMLAKLPSPISKDGQAYFVKEFLRLAKENGILGVVYWEPLWIPGDNICWASLEGQEYINEV